MAPERDRTRFSRRSDGRDQPADTLILAQWLRSLHFWPPEQQDNTFMSLRHRACGDVTAARRNSQNTPQSEGIHTPASPTSWGPLRAFCPVLSAHSGLTRGALPAPSGGTSLAHTTLQVLTSLVASPDLFREELLSGEKHRLPGPEQRSLVFIAAAREAFLSINAPAIQQRQTRVQ